MRVSPVPRRGDVMVDHDRPERALRVSAHPEAGLVVLSVWDDSRCTATMRLQPADVADLVRTLTGAAVAASLPVVPLGPIGSVAAAS